MAARPHKVVHLGLGPIGQGIARLVLATEGLQVVGAADPSPDMAGKDLGAVLGGKKIRVKIAGDPDKFLRKARADVAVLSTSSSLKAVKPQLVALIAARHERRLDLRGAGLPDARQREPVPRARPAGAQEEGVGAVDRA